MIKEILNIIKDDKGITEVYKKRNKAEQEYRKIGQEHEKWRRELMEKDGWKTWNAQLELVKYIRSKAKGLSVFKDNMYLGYYESPRVPEYRNYNDEFNGTNFVSRNYGINGYFEILIEITPFEMRNYTDKEFGANSISLVIKEGEKRTLDMDRINLTEKNIELIIKKISKKVKEVHKVEKKRRLSRIEELEDEIKSLKDLNDGNRKNKS